MLTDAEGVDRKPLAGNAVDRCFIKKRYVSGRVCRGRGFSSPHFLSHFIGRSRRLTSCSLEAEISALHEKDASKQKFGTLPASKMKGKENECYSRKIA